MKIPEYFIAFENHLEKTLPEFESLVKSLNKKRVGSVQIEELCSMTMYPNGLYLFFNKENELLYVGKATSRSFIERIPAHFDQREAAWFNSLPKKIKSLYKIDYTSALEIALSYYLVIIGVKESSVVTKLETILRYHFQPKLNSAKNNSFQSTNKLFAILSL